MEGELQKRIRKKAKNYDAEIMVTVIPDINEAKQEFPEIKEQDVSELSEQQIRELMENKLLEVLRWKNKWFGTLEKK